MMNTSSKARIPPIHVLPVPPASPPFRMHLPPPPASSVPIFNFISNMHRSQLPVLVPRGVRRPPGPLAIVRSTVETHGVRGLWLGHTGTLLRETGGTAAWFTVKEWVANLLRNRRLGSLRQADGQSNVRALDDLLPWESAVSGAIAGAACVLALYPADTVKSAMQTEEELRSHGPSTPKAATKPLAASFRRTLTRMYHLHGLRGLYAGCGMTVARAIPSSGIVFVVYDGLTAWIG